MDARGIFASVMDEAGRLGLAWWERIALILAAALLIVMGKEARRALANVKIETWDVVGGDVNVPTGPSNVPTAPPDPTIDGSGGG